MKYSDTLDRGLVGWLSLAQLISWGTTFYTVALVMGPVELDLDLSRAQSSMAFSRALLVEGVMAYQVGRWIDRGYERVVMTVGSLLAALCLALHGQVSGLEGFYAVWAGLGAAMAATLYSPAFAVVTRRFPGDFRRAIITMTFLGGLASTVFIPLTAWLIALWGWRDALLGLAALHLFVCAPLHAIKLRDAPAAIRLAEGDSKARAPAVSSLVRTRPFLMIGVFLVLMMVAPLMVHWQTWAVMVFVILYGMGNGMLTIVKGTAIAQYVIRDHVATLNGALDVGALVAAQKHAITT